MLRFIINSVVQKVVDSIEFRNGKKGSITNVLLYFKKGIKDGIYCLDSTSIKKNQQNVPWNWQIFYREGYAFGLASVHALFFSRKNPDIRNNCNGFRIMHYTGYGFYKGIADLFHIKRVSFAKKDWLNTEDYDCFYPFLIGGESFAKTIYCKNWDKNFITYWKKDHPYSFYAETAWHGCGRCLWFNFYQDYNELTKALEIYKEATPHLALGLGAAITFTQITNPQKIVADIKRFPLRLQKDLMKGAGIALAFAIEEDSAFSSEITPLYDGELKLYWQISTQAKNSIKRDENWYENTMCYILQNDNL
ncbi:hypothetical protein [Candidatus Uabimicrobium sp. HlEnr_7]|uniref:hypothetical protein n=1 Tax=Candidatus Uabimicrobium helgolandensis TaxID=3095367 RepID=UPI003557165B